MMALSIVVTTIISGILLIRSDRDSIREQLQATATSLISLGIADFSELKDFEEFDSFIEDALQIERVNKIILIYNSSLKLVFSTVHTENDQLPVQLASPPKRPIFRTLVGAQRTYESLILPYQAAKNKMPLYLCVAIPLPKYSEILSSFWWRFALLLSLLSGIAILLSQWLTKRLLKPVTQISDHLQSLDPVQIEEWQPLQLDKRGQYLKSIEDGINRLSAKIRDTVLEMKKMSRYVAHELRTPLTILQGEAESVLSKNKAPREDFEKVLISSLEEVQRMSEIVTTVLQIGERSRTVELSNPVSLNLHQWVEENKAAWEKTLDCSLQWNPSSKNIPSVRIDPNLLFLLMDNLMRNIRKHAPSPILPMLSLKEVGSHVELSLLDHGRGLPASVVDSFNLLGRNSKTVGVGLHLCYTIAEICGIQLQFKNPKEGGLKAKLRFLLNE